MSNESNFKFQKNNALKKLEKAKAHNLVDKGIMPILDLINNFDDYYTSSSCYGRIVLLEIPSIGDKKNAVFLGKWHRQISTNDISESVNKANKGLLWILAQSPIIHIGAKTIEAADKILKKSISCGFKNSGIKSFDKNIIVEVASTERLDSPIGSNGILYCDDEYLDLLIKIANNIFAKSSGKLLKFQDKLTNDF